MSITASRPLFLKYLADYRPLLMVFLTLSASIAPFLIWSQLEFSSSWTLFFSTLTYWIGVLYLRSYTPYAQHNHGHLPVFRNLFLNRLYDTALTQCTGYPTALWELHHNRGHHRHFLTPAQDVAGLFHFKTGELLSRWWYTIRGNLTIHRDSLIIDRQERAAGRKSFRAKLITEIIIQTGITALLCTWNPMLGVLFFIIPNLAMSWFIWWESYAHHLGASTESTYTASHTVLKSFFNFQTFNIGHHTAHHEKPTLHWSLLPQRTEAILEKIPATCLKRRRYRRPGVDAIFADTASSLEQWTQSPTSH